jgi:hypothetical protein
VIHVTSVWGLTYTYTAPVKHARVNLTEAEEFIQKALCIAVFRAGEFTLKGLCRAGLGRLKSLSVKR